MHIGHLQRLAPVRASSALSLDVDGVQRLASGHEQPVPFGAIFPVQRGRRFRVHQTICPARQRHGRSPDQDGGFVRSYIHEYGAELAGADGLPLMSARRVNALWNLCSAASVAEGKIPITILTMKPWSHSSAKTCNAISVLLQQNENFVSPEDRKLSTGLGCAVPLAALCLGSGILQDRGMWVSLRNKNSRVVARFLEFLRFRSFLVTRWVQQPEFATLHAVVNL